MRRLVRTNRSFDLLECSYRPTSSSPFVCHFCRTRLSSAPPRATLSTSSALRAERNGSSQSTKLPFTEKIRRRIWGTEAPPGQADPYGDRSSFDRSKAKEQDVVEVEEPVEQDAAVVEPDMSGYVPATTWDGLEQVGGFGGWWKANWDEEHRFRGFIPPKKLVSREDLTIAIHRAVIEVFTLRVAGRPMTDATNARDDRIIPGFGHVNIRLSGDDQSVTMTYPNSDIEEQILQSTVLSEPVDEVVEVQAEVDSAESQPYTDPAREDRMQTSLEDVSATPVAELMHDAETPPHPPQPQPTIPQDSTWLNVPLQDPAIKFAIIKRVTQLTGTRIPDPIIQQIHTVKLLLHHLAIPPKPAKLAEVLSKDERLTALGNVRVLDRRFTPIDREREVGRWKVIERELERRNLPVTGNA